MASKITIIILCLCFAFVLLISSEAASRDLAETTSKGSVEKNGVTDEEPPHYVGYPGGGYGGGIPGGGYCQYGCCAPDNYGGCSSCCSYAGKVVDATKP